MTNANRMKLDSLQRGGHSRHFYASSVCGWWTGADVADVIKRGHKGGDPFVVWFVPCGKNDSYMIENYAPKVEGAFRLASYGFDDQGAL